MKETERGMIEWAGDAVKRFVRSGAGGGGGIREDESVCVQSTC